MILWISSESVIMNTIRVLILLDWIFFTTFLIIGLRVSRFYWFLKELTPCFIDCLDCCCCFHFLDLGSEFFAIYFFWVWLLLYILELSAMLLNYKYESSLIYKNLKVVGISLQNHFQPILQIWYIIIFSFDYKKSVFILLIFQ